MSLLEQISQRQAGNTQQAAEAEQAQVAESQKPDAGAQATQRRAELSQSMASGPEEEIGDEAATPEEQELFTQLELEVVEALNGPKADAMFTAIDSAQDPVEGIGLVTSDVVTGLRQKYPDTDDEILLAIGETTVEQVVDAYEAMNPSVSLNEDQMAEAFSIGLQDFMQSNGDMVDDDMQSYLAGPPPAQL